MAAPCPEQSGGRDTVATPGLRVGKPHVTLITEQAPHPVRLALPWGLGGHASPCPRLGLCGPLGELGDQPGAARPPLRPSPGARVGRVVLALRGCGPNGTLQGAPPPQSPPCDPSVTCDPDPHPVT